MNVNVSDVTTQGLFSSLALVHIVTVARLHHVTEAQFAQVLLGHQVFLHPTLEVALALLPARAVLVAVLRQADHVLEVGHLQNIVQ